MSGNEAARDALRGTRRLDARVTARDYAAIFFPGGHGTRFDLPDNPIVPAADWADDIVVDGMPVTGQNPRSSGSAAEAVLRLLGSVVRALARACAGCVLSDALQPPATGRTFMSRIVAWIRNNWNEESNVGKAKLAAVAALIFLLISALLPDTTGRVPLTAPATMPADTADAERQAGEAYSSYESRVGELEREAQRGAEEAAAAYRGYEARVAELERERTELLAKREEAGPVENATEEAAATLRAYEARVIALENEKREIEAQLAKLDAGGDAAREAAAAYRDYEARIAQLEHETASGAKAAASTYSTYEARIAELERANQTLSEQLAARDRRIAELEQGGAAAADSTAVMELRLQLEAMRANLDALLKKLAPAQEE